MKKYRSYVYGLRSLLITIMSSVKLPSDLSLNLSPFQEHSDENLAIIQKKVDDRIAHIQGLPKKSQTGLELYTELATENVVLHHNLKIATAVISKMPHFYLSSKPKSQTLRKVSTLENRDTDDNKISDLVKSAVEAQKEEIVNTLNTTPPATWADIVRFPSLEAAAGMTPEQIADQKKDALKRPGTISVPLALRAQVGAILGDQEEAESRKLNITVHNLEESSGTEEERANHDKAEVEKIFSTCEVPLQAADIVSCPSKDGEPNRKQVTTINASSW